MHVVLLRVGRQSFSFFHPFKMKGLFNRAYYYYEDMLLGLFGADLIKGSMSKNNVPYSMSSWLTVIDI